MRSLLQPPSQPLARRYDEALAGVGDLVPPATVEGRTSSRHLHVVRTRHRDQLIQHREHH